MGVGQPLSLQRWAEERERERAHGGAAESRERHVLYAAAPRVSLRRSERRQRRTAPRQDTTARTVLADLREPLLDRAHRFEPSRWVCVAKLKVDRGVTCAAVRQPHLPLFLANSPERPSVRHSRHRWELANRAARRRKVKISLHQIKPKRKTTEKVSVLPCMNFQIHHCHAHVHGATHAGDPGKKHRENHNIECAFRVTVPTCTYASSGLIERPAQREYITL